MDAEEFYPGNVCPNAAARMTEASFNTDPLSTSSIATFNNILGCLAELWRRVIQHLCPRDKRMSFMVFVVVVLIIVGFWILGSLSEKTIPNNPKLIMGITKVNNGEEAIIHYNATDHEIVKRWVENIRLFQTEHPTVKRGDKYVGQCDYCFGEMKYWSPCTYKNNYNFHNAQPCLFLQLSRIESNWKPEFYNDTNNLPYDMPNDLKEHIQHLIATDSGMLNMIWVSCEGVNSTDQENIGRVTYLPNRGFPGNCHPFEDRKGYFSPPLAVHFENPKLGVEINVICKTWVRNMKHDSPNADGMIKFQLKID